MKIPQYKDLLCIVTPIIINGRVGVKTHTKDGEETITFLSILQLKELLKYLIWTKCGGRKG